MNIYLKLSILQNQKKPIISLFYHTKRSYRSFPGKYKIKKYKLSYSKLFMLLIPTLEIQELRSKIQEREELNTFCCSELSRVLVSLADEMILVAESNVLPVKKDYLDYYHRRESASKGIGISALAEPAVSKVSKREEKSQKSEEDFYKTIKKYNKMISKIKSDLSSNYINLSGNKYRKYKKARNLIYTLTYMAPYIIRHTEIHEVSGNHDKMSIERTSSFINFLLKSGFPLLRSRDSFGKWSRKCDVMKILSVLARYTQDEVFMDQISKIHLDDLGDYDFVEDGVEDMSGFRNYCGDEEFFDKVCHLFFRHLCDKIVCGVRRDL